MKPRLSKLSAKYSLNARSIKQVRNALRRGVGQFEDDESIRFRGRALGNEGYINVAVWYFSELDRPTQEGIIREYLKRLESHLDPVDTSDTMEGSIDAGPDAAEAEPTGDE